MLLGSAFTWNFVSYAELTNSDFPLSTYWLAVAASWWWFSDLVVVGLGRRWGQWPRVAVLPVALALVLIDLVVYGQIWDSPLAWGVFLYTELVLGFFALSFVLAAALAVPG